MASQFFTLATIGGQSSVAVRELFAGWEATTQQAPDDNLPCIPGVDLFCESLRAHRDHLTILYYTEWLDRWLFGLDATPSWVAGKHFEMTCLSRAEAVSITKGRRPQHQENAWLFSRLKEAATAWNALADQAVIVIIRKTFAGSVDDEAILEALPLVPAWLSQDFGGAVDPTGPRRGHSIVEYHVEP